MRGALESEEGTVGIGTSDAERGNDKLLKVLARPSPTRFQQGLNKSLQRRSGNSLVLSNVTNTESLRNGSDVKHKPMFRSPLDDEWVTPVVPEWAKPDVNTTYKLAVIKTVLVVAAATVFGIITWVFKGKQSSMEYAAGYLVEQSLSIDNLFV